MKMNNITKLACAAGLSFALVIPAGLSAQGINLGAALKPAMEAFARQMADAMERRWVVTPDKIVAQPQDSILIIKFTNNHKDSARAYIKVHSYQPPEGYLPGQDTASKQHTGKKRSLIADDPSDDSASIYKDLTPWLTTPSEEVNLAPGETKSISVALKVPTDAASGEYAAWVASHVIVDPPKEGFKRDTLTTTVGTGHGSEGEYKIAIQGIPNAFSPGTQIISSVKIVVKK